MIRDAATEAQVRAADPAGSTWLSANAGSGKTRVLTDRVARLLLQGVNPQRVLCLTYTKAAASEMQNRLFARLGAWAMCDDTELRDTLLILGLNGPFDAEFLGMARTLFARAIETPGGLKIQTIHSFCASLLRRFPLEAGVNPQFQEIDERATELLRADVVDRMAAGDDRDLVAAVAQHVKEQDLGKLTAQILRHQDLFESDADLPIMLSLFGLPESFTQADLNSSVFQGNEADLIAKVIPLLEASGSKDQEWASRLRAIPVIDPSALPDLEDLFLTGAGTASKRNPNKGVRTALPEIVEFMQRIEDARTERNTYFAAVKSLELHRFASRFIGLYSGEKRVRGWLDFDDLIFKTRSLLSKDSVASWVLYRLDGGISHILVDEAQDTSCAQWEVIERLTQEFTAGLGAQHDVMRTLFVVGDKKQSIYSFQGADPDEFDHMEAKFAEKLRNVQAPFQSATLNYSFRSSEAILRVVDKTFEGRSAAGFVEDQTHAAFHDGLPGRVDLWPTIPETSKPENPEWTDPVDRLPDTHHSILLARQVADKIADLLCGDTPGMIPEKAGDRYVLRRVQARDIMVLVQRRSDLFHEIIRACKQRDVPIAGADVLHVSTELAVKDLLALLSFLATPEDDLALATVLRSPLGGLSEKDLFHLAHPREKAFLWEALRNAKDQYPDLVDMLQDLRGQIDFLRPYELIERILTRHGGRAKLIARLGVEAEDGLNAILSQALAYERVSVPSLTGFLAWATSDDVKIKRQIDSAGNQIRVMTVHGAKGLEAPIVIMPDCAARQPHPTDDVLEVNGAAIWRDSSKPVPQLTQSAIDAVREREARERLRLLYVAMTRAETWLIVAAAGKLSKESTDWYQTVEFGLQQAGAFEHDGGLRYEYGNWELPYAKDTPEQTDQFYLLEPVFHELSPKPPKRPDPVSPSQLGGSHALPSDIGLPEEIAKMRGTYIHLLLERLAHLPSAETEQAMRNIPVPPQLSEEIAKAARQTVIQILANSELAWIFGSDALSEVSLHGEVGGQRMLGTIDRLIITDTRIIAVDFKSNMAVPDFADTCPSAILRQMEAYAAMLRQIYPDHSIETGVLWTTNGRYMTLPQNMVNLALSEAPLLDGGGSGT